MKKLLFFLAALSVLGVARADTGDIPLSSNFQENSSRPLDARIRAPNAAARLALTSVQAFDGLMVDQQDNLHTYQLQGSTYNWVDLGIIGTSGLNAQNFCVGKALYTGGQFVTTAVGNLDASTLVNPLPAINGAALIALNPQSLNGQFNSIYAGSPEVMNEGSGTSLWRQPDLHSTYIGTDAGFNAQNSNVYNTCVGDSCMSQFNPTGGFCACIGADCEGSITTANACSSVGYASQFGLTSGLSDNSVGMGSMQTGQTSSYDNVMGQYALYNSTDVNYSDCIGHTCMFNSVHGASYNDCMGSTCLYSNTTGLLNFSGGYQSLKSNTSGIENACTGANCLIANTSGNGNNCNGYSCMSSNTTGLNNSCDGIVCMISLTSGHENACEGESCLYNLTTGSDNSGVGPQSLYGVTTGNGNVGVGQLTGYNVGGSTIVTSGSYNTFIGFGASWSGTGQPVNATAIGANSQVNCSSCVALGGPVGSGNEVALHVATAAIDSLSDGCLQVAGHYITSTGLSCGSGGGGGGSGPTGQINNSNQNNVGYYSVAGSSNVISGSNNFTWNGTSVAVTGGITASSVTVPYIYGGDGNLSVTAGSGITLHGIVSIPNAIDIAPGTLNDGNLSSGSSGNILTSRGGSSPLWQSSVTVTNVNVTSSETITGSGGLTVTYGITATTITATSTMTANAIVLNGTGNFQFYNQPDGQWYQVMGASTPIPTGDYVKAGSSNTLIDGGTGTGGSGTFQGVQASNNALLTTSATFVGGTNVTITQSGSSITITSSGSGSPGGNPYDVQVDSNGVLGGYDNFQNNGTTVSIVGVATFTITNVSTQVASGVLFTYDTSTMTITNMSPVNLIVSSNSVLSGATFYQNAQSEIRNVKVSTLVVSNGLYLDPGAAIVTGFYTPVSTDNVILSSCPQALGSFGISATTISLPSVANSLGQVLSIYKVDKTTNPVYIQTAAGDVIAGTAAVSLYSYGSWCNIMAVGANLWEPIGQGCQAPLENILVTPIAGTVGGVNASSDVIIEQFYNPTPCTIVGYKIVHGAVGAGVKNKFDVGVYNLTGNLLDHLGSTTEGTASTVNISTRIAPLTTLAQGTNYYLAVTLNSSVTSTLGGTLENQGGTPGILKFTQSGTVGLPASLTISSGVNETSAKIVPTIGVMCAGTHANGAIN